MKRYSEKQRAKILRGYEQSGMSLWEFCRQGQLNYQTVRSWKNKSKPTKKTKLNFARVEVTGHEQMGSRVTIRMPAGMEVRFENGVDLKELAIFYREVVSC